MRDRWKAFVRQWLFAEYRVPARSLRVYRVVLAGYFLFALFPAGMWTEGLPDAIFSPPLGIAAFFTAYPSYEVLVAVNIVTMLAVIALLIGFHAAPAALLTSAGLIVLRSFCYADGKIDHDILLVLAPALLAFSGWGSSAPSESEEAAQARRAWHLAVLALCTGLAMLTAGIVKADKGWLSLDTTATRWQLMQNYFAAGRRSPVSEWALMHVPAAVWKAMDISTVLWELGLVCLVWNRKLFLAGLAVGMFFHFGVLHLFDIGFPSNVVVYAAFVSWDGLAAWTLAKIPARPWLGSRRLDALAVLGAACALAAYALFGAAEPLAVTLRWPMGALIVNGGFVVTIALLARELRRATAARWRGALTSADNPASPPSIQGT